MNYNESFILLNNLKFSMSKKAKYYSSSITLLLLSTILNSLFLFGSRIIIARFVSSVDLFGYISIIISEAQSVSLIMTLGLFAIIQIELPRSEGSERKSLISSSMFYVSIVSFLSLISSIVVFLVNSESTYGYSLIVCSLVSFFFLFQAFFIGLKKFEYHLMSSLIQGSVFLIFIAIFRNNLNLILLTVFLFVSYLLSLLILSLVFYLKHKSKIREGLPFKKSDFNIFRFNKQRFYLIIVMVTNTLKSYLILKIPQLLGFVEESAYLSIARGVAILLMMLPNVVSSSVGPLISRSFSLNEFEKTNQSLREGMSINYLFLGLGAVVLAYFGDSIILLLYGEGYSINAGVLFYIFLVAMIINSVSKITSTFLLNSKQEIIFAIGRLLSLVFFVGIEIAILYTTNAVSVAVSMAFMISFIIELIIYYYFIVRKNDYYNYYDLKNISLWFLIIFTSSFLGFYFTYYHDFNYLIRFSLLTANIIIFILYLWLTRIINFKQIFIVIKHTIIDRFARNNRTKS